MEFKKYLISLSILFLPLRLFAADPQVQASMEKMRVEKQQRLNTLTVELKSSLTREEKKGKLLELQDIVYDKKLQMASVAPVVQSYLKDKDPGIREYALGILADLRDKGSVLEIQDMTINDPDVGVRQFAIPILANTGGTSFIPHLKILLKDREPKVRMRAAGALGVLGDDSGYQLVLAGIKSQDEIVREEAAGALGDIGKPESILVLENALSTRAVWSAGAYDSLIRLNLKKCKSNPEKIDYLKTTLMHKMGPRRQTAAFYLAYLAKTTNDPDMLKEVLRIARDPSHLAQEDVLGAAIQVGLITN